jgi:diguanylate cyclase (GGDEF)-like protein
VNRWDQTSTLERLGRLLIGLLTAGALALAWSVFSGDIDTTHRSFLENHSKKLAQSARAVASALDSTMAEVEMALGILNQQAADYPRRNYTASREFRSLVNVVRSQAANRFDLRGVDKAGNLRLFHDGHPQSADDLSLRDYFRAQVPYRGDHPYIGKPVKSSYNGQWSINVSEGLPPDSGDLAILVVSLDFSALDKLIAPRLDEEGQSLTIFRGDGAILYRYPLSSVFPSDPSPLDWFSIQAAGTDAGTIQGSEPKVFQRTGQSGLVVVVSRPSEVLAQLWADQVRQSLGWMMVISLSIVGAGWGLWSIESRLHNQRVVQEKLARIDPLTGLLNRRGFEESCAVERQRIDRVPGTLCLALLDLDHFKQVNDRYGHPLGDQVLKEFSGALLRTLRATDAVARLGGEEFAILLPGTDAARAQEIAERVRSEVAKIPLPSGHLSTSIGLSTWDGVETLETWYGRTDRALYQAKVKGRNRVEVADPRPPFNGPETAARRG